MEGHRVFNELSLLNLGSNKKNLNNNWVTFMRISHLHVDEIFTLTIALENNLNF